MKKHWKVWSLVAILIVAIGGWFGYRHNQAAKTTTVKIGLVGTDSQKVWDDVKARLAKENIKIEYVTFNDYVQPNKALQDGQIDLHSCLTSYYFESYNKERHAHLTSIGNTVISPLGLYSKKHAKLSDLPDGATIAIPNEPTTIGRGLNLLQSAGLIKVKSDTGIRPGLNDITENPHHLKFKEVDPAQTPRALTSVDASIINGNYAEAANIKPGGKQAIFMEKINNDVKPYVNIIAAREKDKDNSVYKKVVAAYQTESTKKAIDQTYHGSQVAAWPIFGKH